MIEIDEEILMEIDLHGYRIDTDNPIREVKLLDNGVSVTYNIIKKKSIVDEPSN